MLALVALPRIFFIFASFFLFLFLHRLCYLHCRFLFPLSLSLDWTFLYGGPLGPLQAFFLPLAKLLETFELRVAVAIGVELGLQIEASAFTVF